MIYALAFCLYLAVEENDDSFVRIRKKNCRVLMSPESPVIPGQFCYLVLNLSFVVLVLDRNYMTHIDDFVILMSNVDSSNPHLPLYMCFINLMSY